jgi:large subunit ribosomal protein L10
LNKEAKAPLIDALADRLARSSIAILTDYRGLTVAEISDLRRKLRAAGVEYQVAKNTLTRFAAERVNKTAINVDLEGPTAIAFAYDDPAAAAKALQDYLRTSRMLRVKSAVLGDRRLALDEVQSLAELPSRPQLQARLVGTLAGPMATLVGTINGLLSQLVYAIDQRVQQLESGAPAAAATAPAAAPTEAEAPAETEAPAEPPATAEAPEPPAATAEAAAEAAGESEPTTNESEQSTAEEA